MQPLCSFSPGSRVLLLDNWGEGRQRRAEAGPQQRVCELARGFWCLCVCLAGEVVPKASLGLRDGGAWRENPPCQAEQGDVPQVCLLKPSKQTALKNADIEKLSHKSGGRIKL